MESTKLVQKFGVKPLPLELIQRVEKLTKQPAHHFLKRGIFCGHRDLEKILDTYEKGIPFYLYTGRGPSSESLHLGHLLPLLFTKYLQDAFDVPLIIQMTDDEKFLRNKNRSLSDIEKFTNENLKDLIALGFNPKKTFIFRDTEMIQVMYPNILKMQRHINLSQVRALFGLTDSDCIGYYAFPINQAVPAVSSTFSKLFGGKRVRCLIPCALDQDIYFRMTRDICQRIKEPKPSLILSTFLPDLRGPKMEAMVKEENKDTVGDNGNDGHCTGEEGKDPAGGGKAPAEAGKSLAELSKMSSTSKGENPAVIFLNYTPKRVAKIIKRHAFSGGADTEEEHRKNGGNPDVDLSIKYLEFFLDDDKQLAKIKEDYRKGDLLTGELKNILVNLLTEFLEEFQSERAKITEEVIQEFTTERPLL